MAGKQITHKNKCLNDLLIQSEQFVTDFHSAFLVINLSQNNISVSGDSISVKKTSRDT